MAAAAPTLELARSGFTGIRLDGPSILPLEGGAPLLLSGVRASPADPRDEDDVSGTALVERALLVAAYPGAEGRWVGRAFPRALPAARGRGQARPARLRFEVTRYEPFSIDVFARLPGLPRRAGTLLVALVHLDRASNGVRTRIESRAEVAREPEVREFLSRNLARPGAPAIDPLPADPPAPEGAAAGGLAPPDAPGIALSLERDAGPVLRGAFRLEDDALAVVPIDVLLIDRASGGYRLLSIRARGGGGGGPARGAFELRLPPDLERALGLGSHVAWAFSGPVRSGPFALERLEGAPPGGRP